MDFGLFRITPRDIAVTVIAFAIMGLVAFMLQRTRIGKAMRAVNDNVDLASASGIDVERVVLMVWLLGGALAGIGGVMFGVTQTVFTDMGFQLLLLMFAAVILGGLGSAYGAMIGALVIGLVAQYSTLWFPSSLQNMWALLVMILVLLFRPQGILGRRERVG
jgi:branched-chain amino acid transport system permease protein